MSDTRRADSDLHVFESALGWHLFVADGSQVFDIDESTAAHIRTSLPLHSADELWASCGFDGRPTGQWIPDRQAPLVPVGALSLNVAQSCNMTCNYCYADEGRFGGKSKMMSIEVARSAVDTLIRGAAPRADLLLGFMGGEPLLNRAVIHGIVPYAAHRAAEAGHRMRFSITTNATLVNSSDAALFSRHPFCVQVSIDGPRELNDRQRTLHNGQGSYDRVLAGLELLKAAKPSTLSARVTVTHRMSGLVDILDHLIGIGFDDVGFGLALATPNGRDSIAVAQFENLLREMVACGRKCASEIKAGRRYPFSNFLTAMEEIHKGTHRPYPCGAGAAYLSSNANGELFACHRLIDDPKFAMGNVRTGADEAARAAHLKGSHVDRMQPCASCWARYLCGGGCYHEVARRGRPGCDYIRGWLDFCLQAYAELSAMSPAGYAA